MSEQPGAGSLPELTPEQDAEVRRLLAEARHDEPMPADVADRLDGVLAGLSRDDPGAPGVAPVLDLAARRRRRNAAALLAGAAAVVVAGFAIGQTLDTGPEQDDDAGSAAVSADRSPAPKSGDDAAAQESAPSPQAAAPFLLSSQHLERDITDQLRSPATDTMGSASAPSFAADGCAAPLPSSKYGLGDLFPALYDGSPAVLALRPPADGSRRADVLDCTTARELDTATIPVR
jgi:hypothetical protein